MTQSLWLQFVQALQIIWIDILLSGDNAVVLALACRNLPEQQKRWGIGLGAGAAVLLRIIFVFLVSFLLTIPYLHLVGGVLLLLIAVQLIAGNDTHGNVQAKTSLAGAIATIAIADGAMSLDNVLAIIGVAQGDMRMVVFGILVSIPFVVFGAGAMMKIIERWPFLVWLGGGLLGWVAGDMIADEPIIHHWMEAIPAFEEFGKAFPALGEDFALKCACAAFVLLASIAIVYVKKKKDAVR